MAVLLTERSTLWYGASGSQWRPYIRIYYEQTQADKELLRTKIITNYYVQTNYSSAGVWNGYDAGSYNNYINGVSIAWISYAKNLSVPAGYGLTYIGQTSSYIYHNSTTGAGSFSYNLYARFEGSINNTYVSGTLSVPTIQTSFAVTVPDFNLGSTVSIAVGTNNNSSYTYNLSYSINNSDISGIIATEQTASNYVWEFDNELINAIKNTFSSSEKPVVTVSCETFSDGVSKGVKTDSAIISIVDLPIISNVDKLENVPKIKDITESKYILKGVSEFKFTITASAPIGTSITSYEVTLGTRTVTSNSNEIIVGNILEHDENVCKFSIKVVDGRGNKSLSTEIEVPFIDYVAPSYTASECSVVRGSNIDSCDVHIEGVFYNSKINERSNQLDLQYAVVNRGEVVDLGDISRIHNITYDGNTFSSDFTIDNLDHTKQFDVYFYIADSVVTGTTINKQLPSSQYIMLEHENGVDFLNATIMGEQVATVKDMSKFKIIQGKIVATGAYASGTYITVGTTEIDTTDTITVDGKETKEVVFENNGLITLNYVGLIKINLHLWVRGSSASSRPWIYINDYTNNKPLAEWIDDTSSGFNIVDINDLYIKNDKIGNQIGIYVFNVTGSVTPNGSSNNKLSYINLELL